MLHAGGAGIPHLHNLALAPLNYCRIIVGLIDVESDIILRQYILFTLRWSILTAEMPGWGILSNRI